MSELPQSVLDLVELSPIEDLLLVILREGLPDVPVVTLIEAHPPETYVLVRRVAGLGNWEGDPRFTDSARFFIHAFTTDPNGDQKGAQLSEAVRVVLREAWLNHTSVTGLGSVISIKMVAEPSRKTDFANSAGPVQFASLPTGTWRYESLYEIAVRKPR